MQTIVTTVPRLTSPSFVKEISTNTSICIAATIIVALAAHISIELPFTPVPLTLQPLAVLGVGLLLGPTLGFFSMMGYIAEGLAGLPVFSPSGLGGIAQLLGPTGGFLMAYPFVAGIAGSLTNKTLVQSKSRFLAAFLACSVATAFLFISGAGWLHACTGLSLQQTASEAVLPFLPGELIKILIAAGVYSAVNLSART
ncbi:MAG: biotin transporter BioY [Acidobacteria bacterium]|nr:biotin transporter BioY [Acidobacteriota bacterium]